MTHHNQILAGDKVVDHRSGYTTGIIQGIDIKAWMPKWLIPIAIWGISLEASLVFVFNRFKIEGDNLLEYSAYLYYIQNDFWVEISNNLISSSFWTTYFPALIQRLLGFNDPEVVYRVIIALVTSFLPLSVFLLTREYIGKLIAVFLSVVLYTSYFYQGFAMFARMQFALALAVFLLLAIIKRSKWQYWLISGAVIGLVLSHYTTAYLYGGLITLGAMVITVFSFLKHRQIECKRPLIFTVCLFVIFMSLFYYNLFPLVGHSAGLIIGNLIREWSGGGQALRPQSFEGQLMGSLLLWGLLMVRALVAVFITFSLWRKGKLFALIPVLYVFSVGIISVSLWSSTIGGAIGFVRPSYLLLPIELAGIAYWWGKRGHDKRLAIPLGIWALLYH